MKTITISNLKGGTGKTTTTMSLAYAYRAAGQRVLLVDTDPHRSLTEWVEIGELDLPVLTLDGVDVHKQLAGAVDEADFDVMLIDTPPLDEHTELVVNAMRIADVILLAMAPTTLEYRRVVFVAEAVDQAIEKAGRPIEFKILLNRTVYNAGSTDDIRQKLVANGYDVLRTTIPRLEALAQAFPDPIVKLHGHDTVVQELSA